MKTVVYDALTKTVTIIDTPDEMLDEQPGETVPTIEARVAVIEEAALDLAELQSEMLYQLCLMELGVNANDL